MNIEEKCGEYKDIILFFVILVPIIVILSQGEEYDYDFWKDLSSVLIVVLIFVISSLWAVRTSAFYSSAQERSNFYHYVKDNEKEYKIINKVNLKRIIEDPASQYLGSARSFRNHAIAYNMMLFYLFICLVFLFIQFLFNLKEGNITIWFCMLLFVVGSVIFYLVYKVINEGTDYLKKIRDFFPMEIGILTILVFILLGGFVYFLCKGYCPQHILKICHYKLTTVLSSINILLFSIESYLACLSLWIFQSTLSGYDPYNGFLIWTHDNMDIISSLRAKKGAGINPDRKKENEMVNLWKWSLVLHLKKIFNKMDNNGNINEEQRKNEQHVENLIATLTASEWEDPSILYLSANVRKALGFLRIDNYPIIRKKYQSKNKKRYQNAEEAAEKRYKNSIKDKIKELNKIKNDKNKEQIDNEIDFLKNKLLKKLKKNMKEDLYNEIKQEINKLNRKLSGEEVMIYKETIKREIEYLEKLREYEILKKLLKQIKKVIDKKEIKDICEKLIDVYKNRTKN